MSTSSDSQSFRGYVAMREEQTDFAGYRVDDPSSDTTLGIQSTDSSDTSTTVTIENRDGSTSEDISLDGSDGTTFVTGSSTFGSIGAVTIASALTGDLEIYTDDSGSPGTLLGTIPSGTTSYDKAPTQFADVVSEGFSGDRQPSYLSTIRGRQTYQVRAGPYADDGGFELVATPEGIMGLLLKGALGSTSVTTSDPDNDTTDEVGTHTFTPADDLPSWGVEIGLASIDAVRHLGGVVDELEFAHAQGEELTVTPSIMAAKPVIQGNRLTPSYDALKSFTFHNATFTINSTDRTADVQEWSTTIANGASLAHRNSVTATKAFVDTLVVTHTVTLDFENMNLWEQFFGQTGALASPQPTMNEVDCNAKWTSDETIADTDTNYELEIDTPRCAINTHDANLNEQDLVAEEVEFRSLVDTGGIGDELQVLLTNGVLTAY